MRRAFKSEHLQITKSPSVNFAANVRFWWASFHILPCAILRFGWKTASSKHTVQQPAGRNSISTTGHSSTTLSIRCLWCLGLTAFFCFWTFYLTNGVSNKFILNENSLILKMCRPKQYLQGTFHLLLLYLHNVLMSALWHTKSVKRLILLTN